MFIDLWFNWTTAETAFSKQFAKGGATGVIPAGPGKELDTWAISAGYGTPSDLYKAPHK